MKKLELILLMVKGKKMAKSINWTVYSIRIRLLPLFVYFCNLKWKFIHSINIETLNCFSFSHCLAIYASLAVSSSQVPTRLSRMSGRVLLGRKLENSSMSSKRGGGERGSEVWTNCATTSRNTNFPIYFAGSKCFSGSVHIELIHYLGNSSKVPTF